MTGETRTKKDARRYERGRVLIKSLIAITKQKIGRAHV